MGIQQIVHEELGSITKKCQIMVSIIAVHRVLHRRGIEGGDVRARVCACLPK